ncbi:hypothetical protein Drose_33205 [Dactylosporangium roseum]|uniref:Uncharacterized protein n=1 Tax=Dactylosporangium roseum TaxID=47989 RepID=A0ABY5Z4C6_9ACTN|nr:hypothetical protein [Dactylosporangium roseum]UWZ35895.1 hypothetical protein Drose_33205 [Dactylosporangium roseum]
MRHVGSLIAGMFIAPIAWLLIAVGQQKSAKTVEGWIERGAFDSVDLLAPAAYLLGAGLLIGLIATLRISPVGPIVAGLALLATYVSLFIDPLSTMSSLPDDLKVGGLTVDLRVPIANGTTAVLGLALLIAAASVKRWRTWPTVVEVPAEPAGPVDIHEYPLGHGPKPVPQVGARPPYATAPDQTAALPAGATSILPGPPVPSSGAPAGAGSGPGTAGSAGTGPAGDFGAGGGFRAAAAGSGFGRPTDETQPVSAPPPPFQQPSPVGAPHAQVSSPPSVSSAPPASAPPVASAPPAAQPAVAPGSPPGPFPPTPPGMPPRPVSTERFTPPGAAHGQPAAGQAGGAQPMPGAPPVASAPPASGPSAGVPGAPAWLTPGSAAAEPAGPQAGSGSAAGIGQQDQPVAGGRPVSGVPGTPWTGAPAGMPGAGQGTAGPGGSASEDATAPLPTRPPTVPMSPPPPYGGGHPPIDARLAALGSGAPVSGQPAAVPPAPQPAPAAPAAQPTVAPPTAQPATAPPGAPPSPRPVSAPPVAPSSPQPGAAPLGSGATAGLGGVESPALGYSRSAAAQRPDAATDGDEATQVLGDDGTTAAGLPSRAARGPVADAPSILDGPPFDGFTPIRRGVPDEETEAFHPGRQAPVPSRPRQATPGEIGELPTVDVDADEATTRLDPDATVNLGFGPHSADATTRIVTGPQGSAAGEATGNSADAEGERREEAPPASPWAAPPRDRG